MVDFSLIKLKESHNLQKAETNLEVTKIVTQAVSRAHPTLLTNLTDCQLYGRSCPWSFSHSEAM